MDLQFSRRRRLQTCAMVIVTQDFITVEHDKRVNKEVQKSRHGTIPKGFFNYQGLPGIHSW